MTASPEKFRSPTTAIALVGVLFLQGCHTAALPPSPQLQWTQPVVLLGEVHDNAVQHALRLRAFEDALARGARPVLAMEQLDREIQPELDSLLARRQPSADADAVIALARGQTAAQMGSWDWRFYRPFIALALQHGLPIVAANVSRNDARAVMREGLAAKGFDASVPAPVLDELAKGIEGSHCGMLDRATAGRMALAQVARDQYMARVLDRHAAQGVVLLAGNGHVRTDIGAPRWLSPATRARSTAIGVLEAGDDSPATYDQRVVTAPQPRPDPCEAMRSPRKPA
jgi:uncharacterized iron-regulated protein